jgi:hypothetical protein
MLVDVTATVSVLMDTRRTAVATVVRETIRAGPRVIVIDELVAEEATTTSKYEFPLGGRFTSKFPADEGVLW